MLQVGERIAVVKAKTLREKLIQPILGDLVMTLRVLYRLPAYLRNPLNLAECQAIVRRRIEQREADFLDLVRRSIFANRTSPYRSLLQIAGCEYGDLERLVQRDGLEKTLQVLLREGVYLTVDEFKGRRPMVREAQRSMSILISSATPSQFHTSGQLPAVVAALRRALN